MMGIFHRRPKMGTDDVAFRMTVTRDNDRVCFELKSLDSTMSPGEMVNLLSEIHNRMAVWAKVQMYDVEPYSSMRKFVQDRYGREWWHRVFSSIENADAAAAEVSKFMRENYSVKINWGGK